MPTIMLKYRFELLGKYINSTKDRIIKSTNTSDIILLFLLK